MRSPADSDALASLKLDAELTENAATLTRSDFVVILAPADGVFGAARIADRLVGTVGSAAVAEIPHGAPDVAAAVAAGAGASEFLDAAERGVVAKVAAADGDGAQQAAIGSEIQSAPARSADEPATAELIVRLALERFRLGRTDADEAFAVRRGGPNVAIMLRGSRDALRAILAREFRRRYGRTASAAALTDALTTLQGEALDAATEPVALRVGEREGAIVLDLGRADGRAVVVRPDSWTLVDEAPVLFRRTSLTAALPDPVQGGDLVQLRELLNVADDSWPLLMGYLVAALFPNIAHPVLMLGGMQGTGKTTAAAFLAGLFDPCTAENHNVPRDPEAWAMQANGSWCVVVDNVSTIPEWWSDALCKAVTGAGWIRRTLYENSALSVLNFRRVVVLTSIDAGALRGDLGDRLLLVDLESISDRRRRDERSLRAEYQERRPAILGALLSLAAAVLRTLPVIQLDAMPRMADFARILAAMDHVLSTDALERYLAQRSRVAHDVVASDPVGEAVGQLVPEAGDQWTGTAADLLAVAPEKPPRGWPTNPRAMSGRIRRLVPALGAVGVQITLPDKDDRPRRYTVRRTVGTDGSSESDPHECPQRGCSPSVEPDRPTDPGAKNGSPCHRKADSGRSDGPDGQIRSLSALRIDPGEPGGGRTDPEPARCRWCGRSVWWRLVGAGEPPTCATCHPPVGPEARGEAVEWIGEGVAG